MKGIKEQRVLVGIGYLPEINKMNHDKSKIVKKSVEFLCIKSEKCVI